MSRIESLIIQFLVRKPKEEQANCSQSSSKTEDEKNEHCPYTIVQYREMLALFSKMLHKNLIKF